MNKFLIVGGIFSILAAILHIAIIIGGPDWYRFWGAGEEMATLAENGSWIPPVVTFGIFVVLFIWGLYALSGAGLKIRLPFLKTALVIISSVYSLRGLLLIDALIFDPEGITNFLIWTSVVSFVVGMIHVIGTKQVWSLVSNKQIHTTN